MSRTRLQTFNLALMTLGIIFGVMVTVTLVIWIWVPHLEATAARLLATAGVLLAATFLNWAVNVIFRSVLGRLFQAICYGVSLLCIYAGVVLSLLAVWGGTTGDFILRAFLTLVVLFAASMVALAASAIVNSRTHHVSPPPKG